MSLLLKVLMILATQLLMNNSTFKQLYNFRITKFVRIFVISIFDNDLPVGGQVSLIGIIYGK